ncbi:MAG: hypothetical protein WBC04_10300 [Candidatus Acidiferrales bacterium]
MNSDGLFQELRDDGLYSGRSKVVLADPFGSVSGRATVRVTHNSRSEAEVSIEEFEAPPEYDNNLVAFLNASPPRRQGDKTVVSIGVDFDDRLVTSFELDTDAGIFSASSGMLRTPVLWGFRPNETLSLVLRPYIQSTRQQDGEVLAYPLQGPFENHHLARRRPSNHLLALDGASFIPFVVDGHDCGRQKALMVASSLLLCEMKMLATSGFLSMPIILTEKLR